MLCIFCAIFSRVLQVMQNETIFNVIKLNNMYLLLYLWIKFSDLRNFEIDLNFKDYRRFEKFTHWGVCIGYKETWYRKKYVQNMASNVACKLYAIININYW